MFEKFFGNSRGAEKGERLIQKIVAQELSRGINGPALFLAFKAAQKKNKEENLWLTNNHLLNITKNAAMGLSGAIEDSMYGGPEQTVANINGEIDRLRNELSDEEKRG